MLYYNELQKYIEQYYDELPDDQEPTAEHLARYIIIQNFYRHTQESDPEPVRLAAALSVIGGDLLKTKKLTVEYEKNSNSFTIIGKHKDAVSLKDSQGLSDALINYATKLIENVNDD